MSGAGKDSPEVVRFMTLFARLKDDYCNNDPSNLIELAASDGSVEALCNEISDLVHKLEQNERKRRELFAAPVDPKFKDAWRDYEERYQRSLAIVWLGIDLSGGVDESTPKAEVQWGWADNEARDQACGIEDAIEFARINADEDFLWEGQEELIERVNDGVAAWERLAHDTGFDLQGVFRRRALVPFVLVPRHVAAKYGNSEKLSMLKNLQQAHDAFIFGVPYAALGLMRSILETVLRDHYHATGNTLSERINNVRLPPGANAGALDRLRRMSNAILHLDREKDADVPKMDDEKLEKEIVSLLFVLRALIEGVK